jgi:hypothetical protein
MSVMRVVLQRSLRRSRQLFRVALASSPTARILAGEEFSARFPAGSVHQRPPVRHPDRPLSSLISLAGPRPDAGLGESFDDAVGACGLDVVDGTWQGR